MEPSWHRGCFKTTWVKNRQEIKCLFGVRLFVCVSKLTLIYLFDSELSAFQTRDACILSNNGWIFSIVVSNLCLPDKRIEINEIKRKVGKNDSDLIAFHKNWFKLRPSKKSPLNQTNF